jgi:hypothetical protein
MYLNGVDQLIDICYGFLFDFFKSEEKARLFMTTGIDVSKSAFA